MTTVTREAKPTTTVAREGNPMFRGALADLPDTSDEEPVVNGMPAALWICGALSSAVYVAGDVTGVLHYPGFSVTNQAVSELFALGAPTRALVVSLFTISSALLLAFAFGASAFANRRAVRLLGIALVCGALDGLVLWNFFPMHMRGEERTLTDTWHLVFAANPFLLASVVLGAVAVGRWFRLYSIATLVVIAAFAVYGFSYADAVVTGGPTPGMGLAERIAQYAYGVWLAILAVMLGPGERQGSRKMSSVPVLL